MFGVAINVTLVPAQILLALATMLIDGVRLGFTSMVIVLLVPVGEDKQVALLVSTQVITSLLISVDDVNVDEFDPTFPPLIFH